MTQVPLSFVILMQKERHSSLSKTLNLVQSWITEFFELFIYHSKNISHIVGSRDDRNKQVYQFAEDETSLVI